MPEAITKNRQSEYVLSKICEIVFGERSSIVSSKELTDGFCNTAYDLELRDGRNVIMKVAPLPTIRLMSCEVDMMETEVKAMRLAGEKGIDGVPDVYCFDDSLQFCTSTCFLMEKLEGGSFAREKHSMTDAEIASIHFQTGAYLHRLHQIKSKKFGHFCNAALQKDNWFDAFEMMMRRVIEDGIDAGIDIGVPYDEIIGMLIKHKHFFAEITEASFLHWDSWEGNIFVHNGKITGFIDWERAMWGDPLMEDRFRTHSINQDFLNGYGIKELSESQKVRCRWYDVYLYLIMMFEGFYRHYPDDSQYNWVHETFMPIWEEIKAI